MALTLSPVMCSLILKPDSGKKKNIVFRKINEWLNLGNHKYVAVINRVIRNPRRLMSAFGLVLVAIFIIHRLVPTSFLPVEDQGYFKIELELPEGATLERTRVVTDRAVQYLEKNPYVAYVQNVTGSSPRVGSNQARSELTVILKPWEERKGISIDKIMENVEKDLKEYPECKVYLSTPPVIPGLGTSGGFEMQLEARGEATFDNLVQAADTLMYYAQKHKELTGLSSSLQSEIPQLYFDVDRDKVKMLGVPLADVFSTMKAYTGSVYVNDFNMFNRIYKVYIQAEAPYREHKDNINLFFVKAKDGVMVPLTSLGNASYTPVRAVSSVSICLPLPSSAVLRHKATVPARQWRLWSRLHVTTCRTISVWSGVAFPIRKRRREDRRVLCLRWYSFSYSSFWLRNMKVGRCLSLYCFHCRLPLWVPIWAL